MEIRLTLVVPGRPPVDVVVRAPRGTPLRDVAPELAAAAGRPGATLYVGPEPLAAGTPLGTPPLLEGALVGIGGPAAPPDRPGTLQLRLVAGMEAGTVHPLGPGTTSLGRGPKADIRLADPEVSRVHALVAVDWDGATIADLGSKNGTTLDGVAVGGRPVALAPGAIVRLGRTALTLAVTTELPAAVAADGEGGLEVNRPPRPRTVMPEAVVEAPPDPALPHRPRFPATALVVPLVTGLALVPLTGRAGLLFAVLSPLGALTALMAERLALRRTERTTRAEHAHRAAESDRALAVALAAEIRRRRDEAPDAACLLALAEGPRARLWERRLTDDDALSVRVGTAALPARTTLRRGGAEERPTIADVPVTIRLTGCVLGIAGPRPQATSVARHLLGQVAVLHGPCDVRVAVLCADDRAGDWAWARWLPHLRTGRTGPPRLAATAADVESVAAGLSSPAGGTGAGGQPSARWVVVLDGARALRAIPAVARLLDQAPASGIDLLCLEDHSGALPAECTATAVLGGPDATRLRLLVEGRPAVTDILPDLVSPSWAERLARALAPLRDPTPRNGPGVLPDTVGLVELLGIGTNMADTVVAGWRAVRATTSVLIGVGPDGPCRIDLRRDGPHVLVAGTTGSGKSELLRAMVASLAVGNRPESLCFLLVDYKGGAAFGDCARLPHTVGLVTDLDHQLTRRALTSLRAELRRRERLLRDAGASDIDGYLERPAAPLPRLVVVVDEFATLAEDLPDFVSGLVGIAQRGRSLGVHLVLATQRPGGHVTPDITANTAVRIALRVTDPVESTDVVGIPEAALISAATPGRLYVRAGGGPPTLVQGARAGGPGEHRDDPGTAVSTDPWAAAAARAAPADDDADALVLLVDAIAEAARVTGAVPPPSPWLAPLPESVALRDLPAATDGTLPLGLLDLPRRQRREAFALDPAGDHLLVAGGPRSGRTTLLRTLAAASTLHAAPGDVHLHVLDYAGGALAALPALDNVGSVLTRDDPDRGARLLTRLSGELTARQRLLGHGGFSSVAEQRAHADHCERIPWLLLLIDGWEGFLSALSDVDHGRPVDTLARILGEGPSAGIRVVVTGDRSLLTSRIAPAVPKRLVLRLPDRGDYPLAGVPVAEVPASPPPGRGLLVDTAVTEVQVATAGPDVSGPGQLAALQSIAEDSHRAISRPGPHPFRVTALPTAVALDPLASSAGGLAGGRPLWALVGAGGDAGEPCGVDLAEGPLLVVGRPRSGRSTALLSITSWLAAQGTVVAGVAPPGSPLRRHLAPAGRGFGPTDDAGLRHLLEAVSGPVAVVVDDVEGVVDGPVDRLLADLVRHRPGPLRGVVVAGTAQHVAESYGGVVGEVRRAGRALILGHTDGSGGDLLGVRVDRPVAALPGRGVLVVDGAGEAVQVPLPGHTAA